MAVEYVPPKVVISYIGNGFPYGQCTYYVATRRSIPWEGNARDWYYQAGLYGLPRGSQPKPGAIMVSQEANPLGHVSYVESVNSDGSWVVSEMNAGGYWGQVTYRTVRWGDIYIVGFIY